MIGVIAGNAASINVIKSSLTPSAVSTITSPEQTFTVAGLKTTDTVFVTPPSNVNGVALTGARVSAADTLALKFVNPTAGSVTPAAGDYVITVIRPEGAGALSGISQ